MNEDTLVAPPLIPQILLAIAFVTFVVVGIVTVLVPEFSGEVEEESPALTGAEPSPSMATSD